MRWPNYEVATRALPPQAVCGAMIATWVVQQVLLMILLSDKAGVSNSYVQIASWHAMNGGHDTRSLWVKVLLLHFFSHLSCNRFLFRCMRKQGAAVLAANIGALTVLLRRVMGTIKELYKLFIGHLRLDVSHVYVQAQK